MADPSSLTINGQSVKSEQKFRSRCLLKSRQGKDNCPSENNKTKRPQLPKLKKASLRTKNIVNKAHSQRGKLRKERYAATQATEKLDYLLKDRSLRGSTEKAVGTKKRSHRICQEK